ncbi:MAG TPA: HAD family hydrolase [Thermoanaerobaculia bacterium]|nr:HAD family hydrolase [Thermoanaerobaculia bacterium]
MIRVIAFDADDTLWHNESVFQATETQFTQLLAAYADEQSIRDRLLQTESRNLAHFGYGVKGFTLSMIESAIELTAGQIVGRDVQTIIDWGREMMHMPVDLLDGVAETIETLAKEYRLVLVTKGDLFDQEAKLARSGVGQHFSDVQIVSDKTVATYRAIIQREAVAPDELVMVGNSLRSDVLPACDAGARAVHIPYHLTWAHERVAEDALAGREFARLSSIRELPEWVAARAARSRLIGS